MSHFHSEGDSGVSAPGLILFVHGYMDGAEVWRRTIERLSLPGWLTEAVSLAPANTPLASSGELLESYAKQALEHAEQVSMLGSRVIIVGHSMGGQIAELLATRLAARVAGLVLVIPAPLGGTTLPSPVMSRFESRIGLTDVDEIKAGKRSLAVALDEEAQDILARTTMATKSYASFEQLRAWTGGHLAGRAASKVAAPLLMIATEDKFFTADMLAQEATRFRTFSVEKIGAAGHWPQLEQPEALAHLITRFVQSLPQG